ncbi:hypothetical protein [Arsenicicoccus piscis]|uniref:LuxR family transcriptional regulator n=1 Tax=Arsenicicoccus piscis TaxID=673954 RepID=A0ABQ6HN70_9MICO|nr:hypothetical protein [Arsenicicoccus piscis]GMA19118.1 hypothetical protein GCM10025862_11390 [Arsenicicoccus piscis]
MRHALTSGLEEQSPPGTTDEALRLLAQARLRAVPPELALLLDVLAYLGRSRLRRLARLGIGPATVERAEDAGLVRTERTTCGLVVSWPHPYIGELRRSLLTPVRRLQVARRLWESKDASDDVVSLALWHRDGEIAPPPGLYLRAASRAMHNLDLPLALGLATDAVAAGDGAEASALLALLLVLCGRAGEADAHLASIVWSAPGDGGPDTVDPHALARLVALRSWCLNFALKRPRAATDVLDRATAALADGPGVVPVLAVQRAQQASFRGDPRETLAWTAMVIEDDEAPIDVVGAALQLRCAAQTLGVSSPVPSRAGGRRSPSTEPAAATTGPMRGRRPSRPSRRPSPSRVTCPVRVPSSPSASRPAGRPPGRPARWSGPCRRRSWRSSAGG